MDEIEITLGEGVYRLRPMPARLWIKLQRDEATDWDAWDALEAACVSHPHGDAPITEALSPGGLRRLTREWVRASVEDPFPPAVGRP